MPGEFFKSEKADINKVEAEAKEKKHENLEQELKNRRDLFNKEVDSAGQVLDDADKKVTNQDSKDKVSGYKKDISGYLTQVAEKGRAALAKDVGEGTAEIQSISKLAGSLKETIDNAKLYVPMFLDVEKSNGLKPKADEALKKVREMNDAKPALTNVQKGVLIDAADEAIANAHSPLESWRRDAMPQDMQKIYDAADLPLKDMTAEIAGYNIDKLSPAALEQMPQLKDLKSAKDLFDKEQPNIKQVGDLAELVTNNEVISNDARNEKTAEMGKLASSAIDNLAVSLKTLQGITGTNLENLQADPEYSALYQSLLAKVNVQIKEMADVKLYVETKKTVDGLTAEEKECVIFGTDGSVTKTEKFKQLRPDQQMALNKKLEDAKLRVMLEIDEKTADASDKQVVEGRKKLLAGDLIGAKQDLLAYYQENSANPEKTDRIAEVRGMLQGIAKAEIKQCSERVMAMKNSIEGRFNNNLGKRDTGTLMAQQDNDFIEAMALVLVKAEELVDSGAALTIEDAQAQIKKMPGGHQEGIQAAIDKQYEVKHMSDDDVKKDQEKKKKDLADNAKSLEEAIKDAQEHPDKIGLDGRPMSENLAYMQKNLASYQAQIEAAQKLTPAEYRKFLEARADRAVLDARIAKGIRIYNEGFVVDGYGNNAKGVFDVIEQQKLLNDPDPVKREQNTLMLAKAARDRGLPELARNLYETYFAKELNEQAATIDKEGIRKDFLGKESNQKNINKQLERFKKDYKEKKGADPDEATMSAARGAMENQMVDIAYNKAVKLKVHQSFAGGTGERAKAWNDAYGGKVVLEDIGQEGKGFNVGLALLSPGAAIGKYIIDTPALFTDEEWNALPAKTAIMISITIASMGVASGAVAAAGAVTRGLLVSAYGEAAVAGFLGTAVEGGSVVGGTLAGRTLAWGGGVVVEGVAFGTTQGALSYAIEGDKSTFESPEAYAMAMGHSILTLGLLKGVGSGFGRIQKMAAVKGMAGMSEEALLQASYMPKGLSGAASEAGWWTARTTAEGGSLTGLSAAQSWAAGQEFGRRKAIRSMGDNFLFSAAIGGVHSFMGGGAHEEGGVKEKKSEETEKPKSTESPKPPEGGKPNPEAPKPPVGPSDTLPMGQPNKPGAKPEAPKPPVGPSDTLPMGSPEKPGAPKPPGAELLPGQMAPEPPPKVGDTVQLISPIDGAIDTFVIESIDATTGKVRLREGEGLFRTIDSVSKLKFEIVKARIQMKKANVPPEDVIQQGIISGEVKLDLNNPEHVDALKKKMAPEDFSVLKANAGKLSPEMTASIVRGGVDVTQTSVNERGETVSNTVRIYGGKELGQGAYGVVSEVMYVEKGTTELKSGVMKTPHLREDARVNFAHEGDAARQVMDLLAQHPEGAKHLIRPIFVSDSMIIYEKAADQSGRTSNLEKGIATMSDRDWLTQFAGGVEGLAFMHANGISHNDFKPGNIVIGPQGGILIDIGSKVSQRDLASGRVQVVDTGNGPLAHYVSADAAGNLRADWVAQDPGYNKAPLLSESIRYNRPLDIADKFAVGQSIRFYLGSRGYIDTATGALKPGVPQHAAQLQSIAERLMMAREHPYEYNNNNPAQGKDPYYVSLESTNQWISTIASSLP